MQKPRVGFVGQGYVGGSYANNFERRRFAVVRYSLEEKYRKNKDRIQECDIVFICVPTPTTPQGFDPHLVEEALSLVGAGKIVVIKSTLQPGTTRRLQAKFPHLTILCSPEFLSVASAQEDTDRPFSSIIGMPKGSSRHKRAAALVHAVLPKAPFTLTATSEEAELIKYAHNFNGYTQIVAFNIIYDLAKRLGADWKPIERAIAADPFIPNRYARPIHKRGRGAGGGCFIKDVASLGHLYAALLPKDREGGMFFRALQAKNVALLLSTKKDLGLLRGVYGSGRPKKRV